MYDTVLVPTDGSEEATKAAEQALEIAKRFESEVHVIHVTDTSGLDRASGSVGVLDSGSETRERIETQRAEVSDRLITSVAQRARELGLDTVTEEIEGNAADAITEYAEHNGIELIVIGARGRSAVGKFLLGNVASKVARYATTPVLLVRADE